MKNLTRRKFPRSRRQMRYEITRDGNIVIRQGWHRVRLSHSDVVLLAQISGWQP